MPGQQEGCNATKRRTESAGHERNDETDTQEGAEQQRETTTTTTTTRQEEQGDSEGRSKAGASWRDAPATAGAMRGWMSAFVRMPQCPPPLEGLCACSSSILQRLPCERPASRPLLRLLLPLLPCPALPPAMATACLWRRAAGPLRRTACRLLPEPRVAVLPREAPLQCRRLPGPGLPGLARFVSTQREPATLDSPLLRILKDEIDHEAQEYEPSRGLAMGPPQPFKLEDKAGKLEVTLRRSYGHEDIALTAMYQPGMGVEGEEYEEDEEIPEQNVVHLTVAIAKGPDSPVLEFGCVLQKDDFQIGHVHYVEEKGAKDPNFDGPDFSQLDDHLQRQFKKYLDARGINEDLANYLLDLLEDKEQREYQRWLRNVEAFIRK